MADMDFTAFDAFTAELTAIAEKESIPQVAKTHTRIITEKTSEGKNYKGERFHDYNAAYAKRLGISRQPKTLRRDKGRLYDLSLDDDTLTVPDEAQAMALGQMTGVDGKWGYEHEFLDVSDETNEIASEELTDKIIELIHA